MHESLVDVLDANGLVLHTFPITLKKADGVASDAAYKSKALAAAAHERLVPNTELGTMTARMHVARSGHLEPFGDTLTVGAETRVDLHRIVRELAYSLWEQDGRPEGRSKEYWNRARDQRLRERAYVLWQQDGSPTGRADEYWLRVCNFQAC